MAKFLAGANKRGGRSIPGGGSKIPGGGRMPARQVGGFLTGVPRQSSAALFRQRHYQQVRDVKGRFAGGWGFAWLGLEAANDYVITANENIHEAVRVSAEEIAEEMVSYAKANAPWEDHPGEHQDAREHLQSKVVWQDDEHFTIYLGHGKEVHYGIWLEVRWGGRYAIILPTIELFAPLIAGRAKALV